MVPSCCHAHSLTLPHTLPYAATPTPSCCHAHSLVVTPPSSCCHAHSLMLPDPPSLPPSCCHTPPLLPHRDVAQKCFCGSDNCRGYLGAPKQAGGGAGRLAGPSRDMGSPTVREGKRRKHRAQTDEDSMVGGVSPFQTSFVGTECVFLISCLKTDCLAFHPQFS